MSVRLQIFINLIRATTRPAEIVWNSLRSTLHRRSWLIEEILDLVVVNLFIPLGNASRDRFEATVDYKQLNLSKRIERRLSGCARLFSTTEFMDSVEVVEVVGSEFSSGTR